MRPAKSDVGTLINQLEADWTATARVQADICWFVRQETNIGELQGVRISANR